MAEKYLERVPHTPTYVWSTLAVGWSTQPARSCGIRSYDVNYLPSSVVANLCCHLLYICIVNNR